MGSTARKLRASNDKPTLQLIGLPAAEKKPRRKLRDLVAAKMRDVRQKEMRETLAISSDIDQHLLDEIS